MILHNDEIETKTRSIYHHSLFLRRFKAIREERGELSQCCTDWKDSFVLATHCALGFNFSYHLLVVSISFASVL